MQEAEFQLLVEAHYQPLYRFAFKLARDTHDAADLTQQTFSIWATKGHQLREKKRTKSWLFTTLYREFLMGQRRVRRLTAIADLPPTEQDPPDPGTDDRTSLDVPAVVAALSEVRPDYREPLTLFYLRDHSYREIADMLALPLGTVMSRLSRGKQQLRALLQSTARNRGGFDFYDGSEGT